MTFENNPPRVVTYIKKSQVVFYLIMLI